MNTPILPQETELERVILGAVLIREDCKLFETVRRELDSTAFTTPFHKEAFLALCALSERGDSINPSLLWREMKARGSAFKPVDIPFRIQEMADGVPHLSDLTTEIRKLKEVATRREIMRCADAWLTDAQAADVDVVGLVDAINRRAADFGEPGNGNAGTSKRKVDQVLSRIVTAQTILETDYPEPKWAVKDLIPEGVTFVAGPPKLGKSIFCLNIAVAVASGGPALSHFDVEQGSVLYLALEDGPRRIQARLRKLTSGKVSDSLEVVNEWPRVNQGGLEAIDAWIKSRKDARLLIVDTLKCIRPATGGHDNRNAYDADYEAIAPLTKLVSQRVALLIVHHTRKALADDPLATVSGSYGLTGAADGVLVLARSRNKSNATLSVIGRDVEEQELALEFKPNMYLWSVLGKADEVRRSDERQDVLSLLAEAKEPLSPGEIATLLDKQPVSTRTLIYKMKMAGELKPFGAKYQLPTYVPPEPEPKPGLTRKKQSESVPAFPGTILTGNAPKSIEDQDFSAERSHVPNIQQSSVTPKSNGVYNTGNAGTQSNQPLLSQQLSAFPPKNVPGNAGTFDDWRAPWDNDEPLH